MTPPGAGDGPEVAIESRDYWVKVVAMLQQNWALVDGGDGEAIVHFVTDSSCVFDWMTFASQVEAAAALHRNGFRRCAEDERLQSFLTPPNAPLRERAHPNGPIYVERRTA